MAAGTSTMLAVLIVAGLMRSASAETYTVGGSVGWTFPPNNPTTFYDDWARQQLFVVGDELLFPYQTSHDVMEVTQADLQACAIGNPIAHYTMPDAVVKLTGAGYHGFICSVAGHCSAGMKMNIEVLAVVAPAVSPVVAPIVAPVSAPTVAPVVAPVASPGAAPTVAPVVAPVVSPVPAPNSAPVVAPVVAPVPGPAVAPPLVAPVTAPVPATPTPIPEPSVSPISEPVAAPTPEPEGPPSPPTPVIEEPSTPPSTASDLQICFAAVVTVASAVALVL